MRLSAMSTISLRLPHSIEVATPKDIGIFDSSIFAIILFTTSVLSEETNNKISSHQNLTIKSSHSLTMLLQKPEVDFNNSSHFICQYLSFTSFKLSKSRKKIV
jgi:hypothetical protein